jgi:hypothetical protein
VTPFLEEDRIDPRTSVGLRENGRLVGWLVGHRLGEGLVRYTCLFVHASVSVKGLGFRMLTESTRRQAQADAHLEQAQAVWAVVAGNPMADFVRRRLAPHLPQLVETLTMHSEKELATSP